MPEFFHRLPMARVLMIVAALAILFAPHAASPALAQQAVNVDINAGDTVDGPFRLWGKVNVSRRAPPPPELQTRVQDEFGQPEMTRAWLILHHPTFPIWPGPATPPGRRSAWSRPGS